jgi:hypothetical protein
MSSGDPTNGRILIHGKGSGSIGATDIERRARELVDIDGRSGAEITDFDLARAEAELLGNAFPAAPAEDDGTDAIPTRDPSEPISVNGHEISLQKGPEEEKAVERLALEGVEEAQHEQMLAARRRERRLNESGET